MRSTAVYYATMKPWVALVRGPPRSPSACPVPSPSRSRCAGVVLLGRRLARPGVAVAAGLVLALLPRVTWAAVEARSYALTIALAVCGDVGRGAAHRAARPGARAVYGVLLAAGAWVNAYVLLLLPAHLLAVAVLHGWRRPPVRWVAAAGAVAAVDGGALGAADVDPEGPARRLLRVADDGAAQRRREPVPPG